MPLKQHVTIMKARLSPLCNAARRNHSSASSASSGRAPGPVSDIQAWCDRLVARAPTTSRDTLDLNRSLALHRTLPTRACGGLHNLSRAGASSLPSAAAWRDEPREGQLLRKGWSLAYWWSRAELADLSEDGGAQDYNAPPPYTRRMWASGTFSWPYGASPWLGGSSQTTERTRVVKAEVKKDMVFVHQERTLLDAEEEVQKELRVHVFRKAAEAGTAQQTAAAATRKASYTPPASPTLSFTYLPTSALLFRFSALTFNAHRIHYDEPWTRSFEGHPRVVVHGPLSALLLVELAAFHESQGRLLRSLEYRATAPMYVGAEIEVGCKWIGGGNSKEMELWARQGEVVGMTGRAVFE